MIEQEIEQRFHRWTILLDEVGVQEFWADIQWLMQRPTPKHGAQPSSIVASDDTPETDAHLAHLNLPDGRKVGIPNETVELLRKLERDRDMWLADSAKQNDALGRVIAERDALRSATAAPEKDAARYRYLRDNPSNETGLFVAIRTAGGISQVTKAYADNLIDRAMSAATDGGADK